LDQSTPLYQPDLAWYWDATIDWLAWLSDTHDQYLAMMAKHHTYMPTTLQQLVHNMQGLLETLPPCEHPPKPVLPPKNQPKTDIVLTIQDILPTPLPPSASLGPLPLPTSYALNTATNLVLHSLVHFQKPYANHCPLHKQAPYKIHVSVKPSTDPNSCLIKSLAYQKKTIHPPTHWTNN